MLCYHVERSDGVRYEDSRYPATHELDSGEGEAAWLNKIGDMLTQQLYPGASGPHPLKAFPQHYHLRVRNRGGDGTRRHDYYLYGYPDSDEDKKKARDPAPKYFRSVVEFYDHFLWLLSDVDMDRKNCSCKLCKAATEAPKEPRGASASAPPKPDHGANPPSAPPGPPGPPGPSGPSPAPAPTAAPRTSKRGGPTAPMARTASTQAATQAAPLTQPDESSLFREGEVVWFRKIQEAFRLGIVIRNQLANPATGTTAKSLIKPLSHYRRPIEDVEKDESDMRPFLTFSVPFILPSLQGIADQPMETVMWDDVEAHLPHDDAMKGEALTLEASKIAATRVDHSYSLFNAIVNTGLPANQQSFGGVFLGCEKLGVFEAVRVVIEQHEHAEWSNPEVTFAMVVKAIILERADQGEHLFLRGDIWLLAEFSGTPQGAVNSEQLPPAMRREKAFRDRVKQAQGSYFEWVPVQINATKPERSIRGRFYESEKLGPMLNPQWGEYVQSGHILPIQRSLNNRFDSRGSYVGRKNSRLDAVAGAVPPGTVLNLGPHVVEWA
ncbi:hypothetical protein F5Y04DRAFT_10718 [Hypomontagnella monticulosa]|nr:hypothetical protein F5Y04DRAFT_10718 [Hypomontagnella monticulosa]